jgi:hypothetical protein
VLPALLPPVRRPPVGHERLVPEAPLEVPLAQFLEGAARQEFQAVREELEILLARLVRADGLQGLAGGRVEPRVRRLHPRVVLARREGEHRPLQAIEDRLLLLVVPAEAVRRAEERLERRRERREVARLGPAPGDGAPHGDDFLEAVRLVLPQRRFPRPDGVLVLRRRSQEVLRLEQGGGLGAQALRLGEILRALGPDGRGQRKKQDCDEHEVPLHGSPSGLPDASFYHAGPPSLRWTVDRRPWTVDCRP